MTMVSTMSRVLFEASDLPLSLAVSAWDASWLIPAAI